MTDQSEQISITATFNGKEMTAGASARTTLVDFLRHKLDLTGTHVGCEHGVCGACTVLVDGLAVRSCLMFAVQAVGRQIVTVEGLSSANQDLTDIQKAFWERHGLQCGFCTAGILMSLEEYFSTEGHSYSEDEIKDVLSGHLCRCTGYQNIVRAALDIVSDRTLK